MPHELSDLFGQQQLISLGRTKAYVAFICHSNKDEQQQS